MPNDPVITPDDLALLRHPDPLLTPDAVAAWLNVSTKTLELWRGAGDGPHFVRLNRKAVRYKSEDVQAFISSRTVSSTAVPTRADAMR